MALDAAQTPPLVIGQWAGELLRGDWKEELAADCHGLLKEKVVVK